MISTAYLIDVFTQAEDEFHRRSVAGEQVREVVERAEHAILRLIEADPENADEEARKNALLSSVAAEALFPALRGRNNATPASRFERQDVGHS